ncbi:MAG: hypothetical protein M0010_09070 [Actinomycetota bacterium]|nr:hypothetical protein [Actinomycetota bacterium]
MITPAQLNRAVYLADSGVTDVLRALLKGDPRGRKSAFERHGTGDVCRLFVIGMLLAAEHRHSTLVDDAYEVLTQDLSRPDQLALGILEPDPENPAGLYKPFPIKRFYYVSRTIVRRVNHSVDFFPLLDADECARREELLSDFLDALIVPTLFGSSTGYHSMDGTGVWSWAKGRSRRRAAKKPQDASSDAKREEAPEVVLDPTAPGYDQDAARAYLDAQAKTLEPLADDPDADWGVKTRNLRSAGQLTTSA